MLKFDETRACDAIIRYLEARNNATRANVVLHDSHPDPEARIISVQIRIRSGAEP